MQATFVASANGSVRIFFASRFWLSRARRAYRINCRCESDASARMVKRASIAEHAIQRGRDESSSVRRPSWMTSFTATRCISFHGGGYLVPVQLANSSSELDWAVAGSSYRVQRQVTTRRRHEFQWPVRATDQRVPKHWRANQQTTAFGSFFAFLESTHDGNHAEAAFSIGEYVTPDLPTRSALCIRRPQRIERVGRSSLPMRGR
jgi:hypothetical protein